MIPYMIYLCIFFALIQVNEDFFLSNYNVPDSKKSTHLALTIICFIFIFWFFLIWARQLIINKLSHFTNIWTLIDTFSISLNVSILIMVMQTKRY